MRTKYKAWAKPFLDEHPEISVDNDTLSKMKDYVLEIGSGKGEFLIEMASRYPEIMFIGVEKNVTCAGITAKKLVESGLTNAKIIFADVVTLFPNMKDDSISKIFLNFSDPWPKKRHHKRRLTSSLFLDNYYRILKKDAELIFKTDNIDLFNDSLEYFQESHFSIVSSTNNYDGKDEFDACTEYERNFRSIGTPINRVIYKK